MSTLILLLTCIQVCLGQHEPRKDYRNFPLVISLQFHSLAMPFKDFKSNLKNVGFGIGTEISHSGSSNWVQQFDIIWIRNQGIGRAVLFSTQVAWRPHVAAGFFPEARAGLGYMLAMHPTSPLVQKDGQWVTPKRKSKGMLTIPIGLGMSYYNYSPNTYISPFVGYQMLLVTNYNQTLPVVPQTLLQSGLRIHPNYRDLSPN